MGIRAALARSLGRKALSEAVEKAVAERLAEASLLPGGFVDSDEYLWRSLLHNAQRDLPPVSHDRAIEVAYQLYQLNPLGHRITEMNRDYIVGDGIKYSARNPNLEEVVGAFWTDPVNDLDHRLHDFALEIGLYGELVPEVFVGGVAGTVQLGYIDPSQIKSVIPDKDNPLIRDQVRIRQKGFGLGGKPLDIVRPRDGGKLAGDVFYFAMNGVSNSTRGWPDLLHIADWLDAYDEMLWNILERSALIKSFIYDVVLKDADERRVNDWIRKHSTTPKAGTVRVHNENEDWHVLSPQLGSFESAKEAEVILEHIAVGAGFPKHWLMNAGDVNRATALEMGAPTIRRLASRQKYFLGSLRRILEFVVEKAAEAGTLKLDDQGRLERFDEDGNATGEHVRPMELVYLSAPEIALKDVKAAADMLVNLVEAMQVAEDAAWITPHPIRQVLALALAYFGYDYDPAADDAPAELTPLTPPKEVPIPGEVPGVPAVVASNGKAAAGV